MHIWATSGIIMTCRVAVQDSVSSQVDGMKDAIAANGEKIDMIMRKLDDLLARPPPAK